MIIICEPQCTGINHAEVNAALLTAFYFAFPDEKILFAGEEKHIKATKNSIANNIAENMSFMEIQIPLYFSSSLRRLPLEFKIFNRIFDLAVSNNTDKVIFLSITSPGLIAAKVMLLKEKYRRTNPTVVLHSIFQAVFTRPSLRPAEMFFWFRISFLLGRHDKINYILLSPSIEKQVKLKLPGIKKKLIYIDLPYFFQDPEEYAPWQDGVIRFGSFGFAHKYKGAHLFIKLAEETRSIESEYGSEFLLIGQLQEGLLKNNTENLITLTKNNLPLNREDFDKAAKKIDYAVFCYNQHLYKFTTSGALFDAFSYLKPIIALKTPLFEYYFEAMGDIGYLCNDYVEMRERIIGLIKNPLFERYAKQRDNILKGREKINLLNISKKIRKFV